MKLTPVNAPIPAGEPSGSALPAASTRLDVDDRRILRFGIKALLLGAGGFFLWAILTPLDEGVPTQGTVIVESKRKTVQHLRGGIVDEIKVVDGDVVREGQTLVRLNGQEVLAQLESVSGQYINASAAMARLDAERLGRAAVTFPDALQQRRDDPVVRDAMATQTSLFQTRRSLLQNELGVLQEGIDGALEQKKGLAAVQDSKREQIDLLQKELDSVRGLVDDGYVPRVRMYELQRSLANLSGSRSADIASIARTDNAIAELKLKQIARQREIVREAETQLAEFQRQTAGFEERIKALQEELARIEIKAPVAGTVVGLALHTVGGIVRPGEPVMDIVPGDERLVLEVQVPQTLIDKVAPGLPADVRFSFGSTHQSPQLLGKVVTVSADVLIDQRSGVPYFKAQVDVDREEMAKLTHQKLKIQPGMAAEVVIKTGERTLMNYLLKPLIDRFAVSMKEV